jgi:hypothetical protein
MIFILSTLPLLFFFFKKGLTLQSVRWSIHFQNTVSAQFRVLLVCILDGLTRQEVTELPVTGTNTDRALLFSRILCLAPFGKQQKCTVHCIELVSEVCVLVKCLRCRDPSECTWVNDWFENWLTILSELRTCSYLYSLWTGRSENTAWNSSSVVVCVLLRIRKLFPSNGCWLVACFTVLV